MYNSQYRNERHEVSSPLDPTYLHLWSFALLPYSYIKPEHDGSEYELTYQTKSRTPSSTSLSASSKPEVTKQVLS